MLAQENRSRRKLRGEIDCLDMYCEKCGIAKEGLLMRPG